MTRDILHLNLKKIPDYAEIMTAEEWEKAVEAGAYIPYDGSGYWAIKDKGMDTNTYCFGPKPDWATHVAWFNK